MFHMCIVSVYKQLKEFLPNLRIEQLLIILSGLVNIKSFTQRRVTVSVLLLFYLYTCVNLI